jgi:Mrp family chromosome partitioning ATPase
VIVSRLGHNRTDVASRLRETLASVDAPVVGVVANGYRRPHGGTSYGYGYTYDYSEYGAGDHAAGHISANGASADPSTPVGPR